VTRVALTGGIASGKSHVLRSLARRGVPTIDADGLAHGVLAPSSSAVAAVRARFGKDVVDDEGRIDRRALGSIVFNDPDARRALEEIVHPAVYEAIDRWFASLPANTSYAVADIPLLYETEHESAFDVVVVAMARDGLSHDEASARISSQWQIDEKVRRADYVIWTTGSSEETERQIDAVLEAISGRRPKL